MPTEVVLTLSEISCCNSGGTVGTPYIWPMLLWVESGAVHSACPPPDAFRELLGSKMTRGQTAAIPPKVGVLSGSIDINDLQAIFLVVTLLEQYDSNDQMMQAGFNAYCMDLPKAVTANLAKLAYHDTSDEGLEAVKKQVAQQVHDAVKDQISTLGKIFIYIDSIPLDSIVDDATTQFKPNILEQPVVLLFGGSQLLFYTDNGGPGNVSNPTSVSQDAWDWYKFVFGGANGVYAVDPNGQLLSYADNGSPDNIAAPIVVGNGGWGVFRFLFAGAGDRIYAVDQKGRLLSYADNGQPGNVSDPAVVGLAGWEKFRFLFAGAGDRIYAVDQKGRLLSYADNGQPGNVSDPVVVGLAGWEKFRFLFAGAGDRIYAVDQKGRLLSYADNGQPGNVSDPIVVGDGGWENLKNVFGWGGRIYALKDTSSPSHAYRIQGQFLVPLQSRTALIPATQHSAAAPTAR